MTRIVYTTVYWDQGNHLGFAKKTWDGRLRDVRMMLANSDRPDLLVRLRALQESPRRLSIRTLDVMYALLARHRVDRFERLLAWCETHPSPPVIPHKGGRKYVHATIATARGKRKKNPALDLPDPYGDDPAKR